MGAVATKRSDYAQPIGADAFRARRRLVAAERRDYETSSGTLSAEAASLHEAPAPGFSQYVYDAILDAITSATRSHAATEVLAFAADPDEYALMYPEGPTAVYEAVVIHAPPEVYSPDPDDD